MKVKSNLGKHLFLLISTHMKRMDTLKLMMLMIRAIVAHHYRKYYLKTPYSVSEIDRSRYIHRLIYESDTTCHEQLRMDRYTFRRLVHMLGTIGRLRPTNNLTVDEQVAIFLYILAHHQKNRTMKTNFMRSGETISRYFNRVLNAVLRLQGHLLKAPSSIPEDSIDAKWKWFKVS